jgi:hypothetical protein
MNVWFRPESTCGRRNQSFEAKFKTELNGTYGGKEGILSYVLAKGPRN